MQLKETLTDEQLKLDKQEFEQYMKIQILVIKYVLDFIPNNKKDSTINILVVNAVAKRYREWFKQRIEAGDKLEDLMGFLSRDDGGEDLFKELFPKLTPGDLIGEVTKIPNPQIVTIAFNTQAQTQIVLKNT